ncbi:group II intron maturase-specific domain-containing protein [Frankia casuarinae]|uniref:Group II intron maturase-specific domain-containing protein n=1 Tax=Frankia casuarinae (strain DSM 45818 / CECT 9043 / HFP020203 / CcI3) TaxID=106370 RepID=Q2J576_FRACC|nr:group II intron maturase-specific domain-containing protein [Frankia casuarinae]ABD13566.1 hypothetical protein Francci3_4219 [Frankia casuarinae]
MVHGTREHVDALHGQVSRVLAGMGLALSPAKTRIVHLADGFDFLGFRIVWKRKRGTDNWHVYPFIADEPVASLKRKIRSLTRKLSHLDYRIALIRINQIPRGWAAYFQHAVAKQGDPQSLFVQVDGVRRGAGGWGRWWCEDPGPAAVSSL